MNKVSLKSIPRIIAVAVIYYFSARAGLLLALGNTNASPVWPPSGFAFAAILILGSRSWPGIFIGAFAANVVVFLSNKAAGLNTILFMSGIIAAGNTLEALTGNYLLNLFRSKQILSLTKDFSLFIFAALLMCMVSCTFGATSLLEGGVIQASAYKTVWFTWWMGDVAGIIVLTPVLLSCWNSFREKIQFKNFWKFSVIFILLIIYMEAEFNGRLSFFPLNSSIYLLLIILTGCVFAIEQWQSSLIVLLVSGLAIWNTLGGKGPFISDTQNNSLLSLQIFICVSSIIMMFLSTTLNERRESEQKLEKLNSNLEKAQKELEESVKVKDTFLANMSHEIRTPMNAIVGFTELMEKTKLDSEQEQYVDAVKKSGQNLLVIINDILDFSKIRSGKIIFEKTELKLSSLLDSMMMLMLPKANEKKISLSVHCDDKIPDALTGDPTRMSQILINLADNAIKFTEKGEVKISVRLLSENDDSVMLRFEVSDTGIGIPQNKISSVFEGFTQASNETTRKYGGTGLGLAIVKQLVEMQNGSIHLESRLMKGSVFTFNLPFGKNIPFPKNKTTGHANENFSAIEGLNILVAEDNEMNQMLIMKMLEGLKSKTDLAWNGKIAIEKTTANKYDLVLLDIQLPEKDGYEVARYIRRELTATGNAVPIIAVTAHAMHGEEEKCFEAGMNGYITKPFSKKALFEKIRSVMSETKKGLSF
ncbi:MAG: MASE1 domain-containing protein [Bacteroidetes bacterium]|nr:MASE1 domain-containing protein [Bacteroidota bacterium]